MVNLVNILLSPSLPRGLASMMSGEVGLKPKVTAGIISHQVHKQDLDGGNYGDLPTKN